MSRCHGYTYVRSCCSASGTAHSFQSPDGSPRWSSKVVDLMHSARAECRLDVILSTVGSSALLHSALSCPILPSYDNGMARHVRRFRVVLRVSDHGLAVRRVSGWVDISACPSLPVGSFCQDVEQPITYRSLECDINSIMRWLEWL